MNKRLIFPTLLFLLIFIGCIIAFNHKKLISEAPTSDTVEAIAFSPIPQKNYIDINLKAITAINFPSYKITKEAVFIPDSISLAVDEENIASGNYTAIITLDTLLEKAFIQKLHTIAAKDTCWKIKDHYVTYERKEKSGGKYNLSFSTKGTQITITHTTQ